MIGGLAPFFLGADPVEATKSFWEGIDFGASGTALLLTAFVLSLLRGWLVPRRILLDKEKQLTDERADHAAEVERINSAHEKEMANVIDDRNQWRSVAHLKDEAHRELARSIDQTTDALRSINSAFIAFPEGVRRAQSAIGGENNA